MQTLRGGGQLKAQRARHVGTNAHHENGEVTISMLSPTPNQPSRKRIRTIGYTISLVLLGLFIYKERAACLRFMDRENLQLKTLSVLNQLKPDDPNDVRALVRAMLIYMAGISVWEILGMSTIPVETAAGMVFGWPGAIPSISGKVLGACIAFGAGRTFLGSAISKSSMLQKNSVFKLLNSKEQSKESRTPLETAFLMKFSCFPEFIKNFGSSLLPVIRPWMFFVVTLLHGGTFSLLWTWLGVDTAARMAAVDKELPVNRDLQIALIIAGFVGMIVTPAVMAWWIRDLRKNVEGGGLPKQI